MKNKAFTYTGCDNLEVMSAAENYNNFLVSLVSGAIEKVNKKNVKVLDFGAGSGTYTDMLQEKHHLKADCLEPDKTLHDTLKSKGYTVFSKMSELPKDGYDVIYALNVFEHIEDDHDTLKELSGALKKGGYVVIYVPAFQVLFTSMDAKVGHHRRYRTSRLQDMATQAGLTITSLQYCDPLGFGAALAYKAIGSKEGNISPGALKFYDKAIFPISKAGQIITKHTFGKNALLIAKK